jgi:protoheme IX farnesyltransferase
MQPDSMLRPTAKSARTQRLLISAAVATYILAVIGGATPALGAVLLSAVALAALGAALFACVASRVGPAAEARMGARAQAAQRRYRTLTFAGLGFVYMTLVAGVAVANQGALWDCLALPACPTPGELASIAMAHRILAAFAALLVAGLALQTWRTRAEPALRRAAGWSLGLMLAQVFVGLVQVALARGGDGPAVLAIRAGHLAVGAGAWAALVVQIALVLRLPFRPATGERPYDPSTHSTHSTHSTSSGQASSGQASSGQASSGQASSGGTAAVPVSVFGQDRRSATEKHAQSIAGGRWLVVVKDYISLTKPGVITLLIFTTVASMCITPAGIPSLWLVLWTFVGGWLMASGAHAVNCWADQDIDINMGRTSRRPIPSGRIPAWHALALGLVLGVVAFAILVAFVNLAAALLSLAGYLYYVLIYTGWLKRSTPSNIVIGGGAGAFPPLVGWAAASGGLTLPALFLFAIIFYWTPPHFWALALIREKDYARASVPMLPVVAGAAETKRQILLYTLLMLALTIMPTPLQMFGLPYLLMAIGLGALFLRYVVRLLRQDTTAAAWGLYKFSLLYLALLFVAMLVDRLVFK